MDLVTGIVILGSISLVVIPITLVMRSYYGAKAALSRKMSAIRAQKAVKSSSEPTAGAGIPAWLPELLEQFGVDESILESDELPPEISRLLPLAKGFIEGGGLERLLGPQQQEPQQAVGETWY